MKGRLRPGGQISLNRPLLDYKRSHFRVLSIESNCTGSENENIFLVI